MTRLLPSILRRAAAADAPRSDRSATAGADPAAPAGADPAAPAGADPAAPAGADPAAPAGIDDQSASTGVAVLERARLRRRLRFLRRQHELLLRDLGGLVFDLHRFGQHRDELVATKLATIARADGELRALARALGDERPVRELRVPGIGGSCPSCGALLPSDARFCAYCATPAAAARHAGGPLPTPVEEAANATDAGNGSGAEQPR